MKTGIRYALVIAFVVAVLVLAQAGSAWADPGSEAAPLGQGSHYTASEALQGKGGTVKPPRNHLVITKPGTYSVGGCLIHVTELEPGNAVVVDFIPRFHFGRRMHDSHPRFRSGTCHITHFENGKWVEKLDPENGSVYACFAAPRNPPGTVHEWDFRHRKWNDQPTTYEVYNPLTGEWRPANADEPALTCGLADLTGYYLVSSPQSN